MTVYFFHETLLPDAEVPKNIKNIPVPSREPTKLIFQRIKAAEIWFDTTEFDEGIKFIDAHILHDDGEIITDASNLYSIERS